MKKLKLMTTASALFIFLGFLTLAPFQTQTEAHAQALLQQPFVLPPQSEFIVPKTPAMRKNQKQLVNPYYRGEATWAPPGGIESLFSQLMFPTNTVYSVPGYEPGAASASRYYEARIRSLPDNQYFRSYQDEEFQISGRDIAETTSLGNGNYRLKKDTAFYTSTPVQNKDIVPETKDPKCHDYYDKIRVQQPAVEIISDLQSDIIKNKVLQAGVVPQKAFLNAWKYYQEHPGDIKNKNYMTVIDYNLPSDKPRFFLINLKTGATESQFVTHGVNSSGSGPSSKFAMKYSNRKGSKMSSPGAYLAGETYHSQFLDGAGLKLDGQISGVNSEARARTIYAHSWPVVETAKYKASDTEGCFGLEERVARGVFKKVTGGSLWYVEPYANAVYL